MPPRKWLVSRASLPVGCEWSALDGPLMYGRQQAGGSVSFALTTARPQPSMWGDSRQRAL